MFELLASVIGLGIASTLSPVILAISVSLSTSRENPVRNLVIFILGGVLAVALIAFAGSELWNGTLSVTHSTPAYAKQLDLALAGLLILFGIIEALPHKKPEGQKVKSRKSGRLFLLGFLINITNFDAVLFNLTAVREVIRADISFLSEIALILLAGFFFLLPSLAPLLLYLAAPKMTERLLKPVGVLMEKYGTYLVSALFIVFGVYLLLRALG